MIWWKIKRHLPLIFLCIFSYGAWSWGLDKFYSNVMDLQSTMIVFASVIIVILIAIVIMRILKKI